MSDSLTSKPRFSQFCAFPGPSTMLGISNMPLASLSQMWNQGVVPKHIITSAITVSVNTAAASQ